MVVWKEVEQLIARNAAPRPALRKQLRLATQGDHHAYLSLVDHYLNLVVEYLYLNGGGPISEVSDKAQRLFFRLWELLPYTSRLSDFERMLALALIGEKGSSSTSQNALMSKIMRIRPYFRFLLITNEMENWHRHWIGLASRLKTKDLHDFILNMRCEMCGIDTSLLLNEERHCLNEICLDLESPFNLKKRAAMCAWIKQYPKIKNFKARWLEKKCELVELRQEIRLSNNDSKRFIQALGSNLHSAKILQPQWVDRIFNTIHFESFPSS
jgi:hypothetical protein